MKLAKNKLQSHLLPKVHKNWFPGEISEERTQIQIPQNGAKRKSRLKNNISIDMKLQKTDMHKKTDENSYFKNKWLVISEMTKYEKTHK